MSGGSGRLAVPGALDGRRPTWIEINLDALADNFRALSSAAGARPLWCVVKANAYGHGGENCGLALEAAGAAGLVVALPEEGANLRRAGVKIPILLSGPLPADGAAALLRHRLTPALSSTADLQQLEEAAARQGQTAAFHLELDTGMTRMGLPSAELTSFLELATRCRHCQLEAVLSHLASVSRPDDGQAQRQKTLFQDLLSRIRSHLSREVPGHMASSPALCGYPDAVFDMVRPGLLLYGVAPAPGLTPPAALRPVLSFRASIVLIRSLAEGAAVGYEGTWIAPSDTQAAIISAGYADGLLRDVAGRAEALLHGRRVPYVGAVNMDLAQLDMGMAAGVRPGDVVTLIGREGDDAITVEELARCTGRTAYEWLTSLGARVPRLVRRQGRVAAVAGT